MLLRGLRALVQHTESTGVQAIVRCITVASQQLPSAAACQAHVQQPLLQLARGEPRSICVPMRSQLVAKRFVLCLACVQRSGTGLWGQNC